MRKKTTNANLKAVVVSAARSLPFALQEAKVAVGGGGGGAKSSTTRGTSKVLSKEDIIYLAGFLDGDGCINAQIVPRKDYLLKFQIRVSITFFQKTKRHWFMLFLHKKIGCGTIRKRNDGISEYAIIGNQNVKSLLEALQVYLQVKRKQCNLILKIISCSSKNQRPDEFLKNCDLVDQVAALNDSKKRTNTAAQVRRILEQLSIVVPVETSTCKEKQDNFS